MSATYTEPKLGARLEISGGKCATVEIWRGRSETHQIVFKLLQKTKRNVTVYSRMLDDNSVSFALCFERSNAKYFPVVQRAKDKSNKEEIQFQVRKISGEPSEIVFDDMYLFKWGGGNDAWGTLVSVAEPSKYLSVSGNRVVLSSKPHSCFRIIPQHDFPIL